MQLPAADDVIPYFGNVKTVIGGNISKTVQHTNTVGGRSWDSPTHSYYTIRNLHFHRSISIVISDLKRNLGIATPTAASALSSAT
jgi:hypothetical protein